MGNPTKNIPDDKLVTQHNALVHSRQTFTLLQQRILALAVAKIRRSDNGDKEYEVKIRDLVELGTSTEIYSRLEKEAKDLVGKVVTHKGTTEDGKRFFEHWSILKKASYEEGTGVLKVEFHSEIRDMLFQLKGQFSSAVAIEKASCQSIYGVRIYEMLVSHWRFGEWEVSMEDLRHSLGLEGKYKNFSDFRRYVLNKAQKDLKKHTHMRFDWEPKKRAKGRGKGKKVTHVAFEFSWKPNQLDLGLEEPNWADGYDIYNLRERIQKSAGIHPKEVHRIMEWVGGRSERQQEAFKNNFHKKFEVPLQSGSTVANGKRIENPRKYFLKNYADWMPKS